mmetsp:Transcript_9545/g.21532  ORF Transcript_9545/g.21532 Transcript_9545/m.21532 type:complete len:1579 (+) Transcript_9545:123-4859(+)
MGVPKFYRWISERYPKINQVITNEALLPEFDHLYLDMNGIIHGCTHPNHLDVSDVLTERDMVLGIMHYLDRIITQIVKPKVSVYMAIDGVAPRAKLNQQRSRRFRSAKDLAAAMESQRIVPLDGADVGAVDPYSGAFDSNCITPGTEFLLRISNCIRYFIRKKIKEDPLWRNLSIIFSGPEVPGEGEHKIMQHIRDMRNQPGYQPNTRHCMYGQDADLIMLGLVSHEPHFTLLREIVDFSGGFSRNDNALKEVKKFTKQSDFQLLHLSILREYLQLEFAYELDENTYNLERLIDDFVFMTFLVGNDFLPHMPTLDIGDGAFTLLFETYNEQRVQWGQDQYLTNAGEISDAARLEAYLKVIGAAEGDIFEEREKNQEVLLKKQRKWDKRDGKLDRTPSDFELKAKEDSKQNEYMDMVQTMMADASVEGSKVVDGWTPMDSSEKDYKGRYYFEKLHLKPTDVDGHLALRKAYIEGLIWCLAYYYRGCISWGWFFPYHYGPMLSDLTNLPEVFKSINFEVGQPLKPFEQLMGCLPPASSALVPPVYRKLMSSAVSPIKEFYPEDFVVDMNGKRNPWEGVNILSFIDVNLLKSSIEKHCPDSALTVDERHRNRVGKVFCYTYDAAVNDMVPSCNRDIGLPNIVKCNSRVDVLENPATSTVSFKPELIPGTKIPYPGFPSLNVLPMESVELRNAGVNCFGFPSKYPNMILTMHTLPQLPGALQLAGNFIGKTIFVNWPMMHEAKVVAVSDPSCEVRMVKKKLKTRKFTPAEIQRWNAVSETAKEQYLAGASYPGSGGVSIGDVQIRLKVVPLQGMKTSPVDGSSKRVFGKEEADIPIQMALSNSPAPDPRFIERGPMTLKDRFPSKCRVVLTKGKYRGCIGTVLSTADTDKAGVKVQVIPPEPPFGLAIARSVQESYISASDAAKVLRIDPRIFGKVTGNLFFRPGKYDLGLNLKYKDGRSVLGYTRVKKDPYSQNNKKKDAKAWSAGDTVLVVGSKRMSNAEGSDSGGEEKQRVIWEYTPKAVRLVAAYKNAFPHLFAALSKAPEERSYDAKRVFGPKGEVMCAKVLEWLKSTETAAMPRLPHNTDAMPAAAVHAVQRAADVRSSTLETNGAVKESNVKVPPSALYREGSTAATDLLLASEHSVSAPPELGDRVANLCANGVPFGARGTVVAIHDPSEGCVEVVMDEEFIGGSTLQGTCANFRGKLCVWNHLLKISAADSKAVVDSIIPAGTGKAVVDKLMKDVHEAKPVQKESTGDDASGEATNKATARASTPPKQGVAAASGRDRKNPWGGSPPRSNSAARGGRQVAWKNARGPPEKLIGFTNVGRKAKNGFKEWKKLVSQNGCNASKPNTTDSDKKGKTQESNSEGMLKSMLGVKSDPDTQPPMTSTNTDSSSADASAGLKALLGVAGSNEPRKADQPPPPKESAADSLMQMMMMKEIPMPPPPQVMPVQQATGSAFNFSYVKEGDEQPEEPQKGAQPPMNPMPPAMAPQYFPPQGPPVHMMPPHMMAPNMMPPHMMPPNMMPQMHGMNVNQQMARPPPPVAGNGTTQARASRASKPEAKKTAKKAAPMVPSVVVKAKK